MIDARRSLGDERGLVGKLLVLWLVLGALFLVLAYDGVQIALTRFRVAQAAESAAFEGATTLRTTRGDRQAALRAAEEAVEREDPDLRLVGFLIDPQDHSVTVTVTDKAATLLAGRIGFLRSFTRARTTETSASAGG